MALLGLDKHQVEDSGMEESHEVSNHTGKVKANVKQNNGDICLADATPLVKVNKTLPGTRW